MPPPVDDRSPTAQALSKVSHISSISLMMVIPAMIGYFIDQYLGTVILFTAIGLVCGVAGAVIQLIQFVSIEQSKTGPIDYSNVVKLPDEEDSESPEADEQ